MKFGALLRTSAGEVPELQELFTAYKQLKKHLKVIAGHYGPALCASASSRGWHPACADMALRLSAVAVALASPVPASVVAASIKTCIRHMTDPRHWVQALCWGELLGMPSAV